MPATIKALDRATGVELAALPCPEAVKATASDVWRLAKQARGCFREHGLLTPAQAACALFMLVETRPEPRAN